MAETTRERRGELMRGVLDILRDHPDGVPAHEVMARLENLVPPTPFEDSYYPNNPGVRRREKIVRFASIPFVKAGWLRKYNGIWFVTEEGRKAYETFVQPSDFVHQAVSLYRIWKKSQAASVEEQEDDAAEEEVIERSTTLEEAEEAAWAEIRAYLLAMNPYDFQDLVASLLKAMDYHVSWVSPPGPDRGLDIVAYTDPLGAGGPRIKVQVKRRADRVPVDGIRAFMALLGSHDVGLFVCTGGFTSDAEREVRSQETRRLTLLDLDRLVELWVEHYDRIPELERGLLPLRPVHFLDPRD